MEKLVEFGAEASTRRQRGLTANDNGRTAKADALSNAICEKLQDPAWAALKEESIRAYRFGVQQKKRLRDGEQLTDIVRSVNVYIARRDVDLDTTRAQAFFLLYMAYLGAGLKSQADRAQRLYHDPYFTD
jgi:hypothetical protein